MATLTNLFVVRGIGFIALVTFVLLPSVAAAQQSPVYVGATVDGVTQAHSDTEPLGGTTWGGSVVFGVQVSRRVAIEFEPTRTYTLEDARQFLTGQGLDADANGRVIG